MKVRFHPLAERELIAAALYIENEAGLGNAFLDEFQHWLKQIQAHPESCPEIGFGIRKGILPRFKYLIGYKIKGSGKSQSIRILYIRHSAQDRSDWNQRS